jgi:hypothetical protein
MEVAGTFFCFVQSDDSGSVLDWKLRNFLKRTHRIEGGIGVILTWWPIKAYRPCPNFIERGGFYQRSGQGLDEIAFGRDSTFEIEK